MPWTAAGLLKSLEDRDIHVKRYELTTYGQRVPPRFCYGHRVVTSIDSFTPPAAVDGMQPTQVNYHYKMMDIPGWADSDQMRKAFPAFAKATSADAQGQTTVVLDAERLARAGVGMAKTADPMAHRLN